MAVIVVTVVQVNSFTQNIFNGSRPRDPHIRPVPAPAQRHAAAPPTRAPPAGLFWFLYPVGLVICNDSMAYFCGALQ